MTINKIDEFAKNGDKSISGLTLTAGFPLKQKPFRQWFNWILNNITAKTNELVTDVNKNSQAVIDNANAITNLDAKVAPLFEPIQVGEFFFTTNDYQSPQDVRDRHGYGTWERYAEGRTLVGYSQKAGDPASYKTMGNEFGENTHQLSLSEMPEHKHSDSDKFKYFTARHFKSESIAAGDFVHTNMEWQNHQITESEFAQALEKTRGSSQPHNNIQPSIVVAYWLRTA